VYCSFTLVVAISLLKEECKLPGNNGPILWTKKFEPTDEFWPPTWHIRRAPLPLVTVMGIELVLWPNKGESGSNK
jgi:hypothetical protein